MCIRLKKNKFKYIKTNHEICRTIKEIKTTFTG